MVTSIRKNNAFKIIVAEFSIGGKTFEAAFDNLEQLAKFLKEVGANSNDILNACK